MCNVSCVTCHMLSVRSHVSGIKWQVSDRWMNIFRVRIFFLYRLYVIFLNCLCSGLQFFSYIHFSLTLAYGTHWLSWLMWMTAPMPNNKIKKCMTVMVIIYFFAEEVSRKYQGSAKEVPRKYQQPTATDLPLLTPPLSAEGSGRTFLDQTRSLHNTRKRVFCNDTHRHTQTNRAWKLYDWPSPDGRVSENLWKALFIYFNSLGQTKALALNITLTTMYYFKRKQSIPCLW